MLLGALSHLQEICEFRQRRQRPEKVTLLTRAEQIRPLRRRNCCLTTSTLRQIWLAVFQRWTLLRQSLDNASLRSLSG